MRGFTLVELLVGITILGILGILGFIYNRTFQATQALNEGISQVQDMLRTAQSNATARVKCKGSGGAVWLVTFATDKTLNLKCRIGSGSPSTERSYILPANVEIRSIKNCADDFCVGCEGQLPFSVNFSPLYGNISFEDTIGTACVPNQTTFHIKLINTQINEKKNVSVRKGGSIDAQK